MKLLLRSILTLTAAATLVTLPVEATYVVRNGSLISDKYAPTMTYLEHYSAGCAAFEACDWNDAHRHFFIVANSFNNCPRASESLFYLAVCFFNMDEFDIANANFDDYLASNNNPQFFELAFSYKFAIAEQFRCGSRRRYCGSRKLPKWACGRDLAVTIYDEVISSMPSHELALCSLYSKGWLLWEDRDFKGAVESFQGALRRFPKHELTPVCYILINHVYLEQAMYEFQNPDLLAHAEINAQRFIRAFPKEDRIVEIEALVQCVKEVYAKGLYEIAIFYEKTGKPKAAILYYQNTIARFPDTGIAQASVDRLECIRPFHCEAVVPRNFYEQTAPAALPESDVLDNADLPEEAFNEVDDE